MLRLKNIVKEYDVGDEKVPALKGVSLEFRENELYRSWDLRAAAKRRFLTSSAVSINTRAAI